MLFRDSLRLKSRLCGTGCGWLALLALTNPVRAEGSSGDAGSRSYVPSKNRLESEAEPATGTHAKSRSAWERVRKAQRHWSFHRVDKNIREGNIQALPDSFFILISPPFLCSGLPFYKTCYKYKIKKKPIKKFKNYKRSNSSPGPLSRSETF